MDSAQITRISSRDNSKIKQVVKLMQSSKLRRESGLFVLEGVRLCTDLLRTGVSAKQVFVTESALSKNAEIITPLFDSADEVYLVEQSVFAKMSDTQSPQGIICVAQIPQINMDLQNGGKYVFLCNVFDPSNLGAVSRSAEALGIDGMFVSGGCDVYHPKALRASMGALVRIPTYQGETDDILSLLHKNNIKTFASTPREDAKEIYNCDFSGGCCVLIGNEANGLEQSVIQSCTQAVTIPMQGRAESLNASAAAAILLYEMMRP